MRVRPHDAGTQFGVLFNCSRGRCDRIELECSANLAGDHFRGPYRASGYLLLWGQVDIQHSGRYSARPCSGCATGGGPAMTSPVAEGEVEDRFTLAAGSPVASFVYGNE